MIWSIIISGKSYSTLDWAVAGCITFGVTEFLMTGNISAPADQGNSIWGLVLLVGFLACDGLTSTFQEKLFKEHKTSKFNQMLYVNGCSGLTSLIALLATGNLGSCIAFTLGHAEFARDVMLLSGSAAGSQYFIYSQVKEFGALVFAATMNVRQVVSIIVSYITYHHVLTWLQGIGLLLVFGALFYKSYFGLMAPAKPKEDKVPVEKKEATAPLVAQASGPQGEYSTLKPRGSVDP